MKRALVPILPIALSVLIFAGPSIAIAKTGQAPILFQKVADTATPIPGRGENFASFASEADRFRGVTVPGFDGGTVVFYGHDAPQPGLGCEGIFAWSGGVVSTVVDADYYNANIPDIWMLTDPRIDEQGTIYFMAREEGAPNGIFRIAGGSVEKVAALPSNWPSQGCYDVSNGDLAYSPSNTLAIFAKFDGQTATVARDGDTGSNPGYPYSFELNERQGVDHFIDRGRLVFKDGGRRLVLYENGRTWPLVYPSSFAEVGAFHLNDDTLGFVGTPVSGSQHRGVYLSQPSEAVRARVYFTTSADAGGLLIEVTGNLGTETFEFDGLESAASMRATISRAADRTGVVCEGSWLVSTEAGDDRFVDIRIVAGGAGAVSDSLAWGRDAMGFGEDSLCVAEAGGGPMGSAPEFFDFGDTVSVAGHRIAFTGWTDDGKAVYVGDGEALTRIAGVGDTLFDREVTAIELFDTSFQDDSLLLWMSFEDGVEGFYVARNVPEPATVVLLLMGWGAMARRKQ